MSASPPTTLADLDRIIDLYYYEQVNGTTLNIEVGGAGAYCYFGQSELAPLAGTELEGWVDRLMQHIKNTPSKNDEDFRVEFEGIAWRACRDTSPTTTQISIRRLAGNTPLLADLRIEDTSIRELLLGQWMNDGGLVVVCGLTGQGKTTLLGSAVRSRLEKYGGRCVAVEDVSEMPLEGIWGRGSCRQLCVNYEATGIRHGFAGAVRRAYRSLPATRPAILYIGEIRDGETAEEVVKAASNGMLVVSTVHAIDPTTALLRVASLAESAMGEAAYNALGQSLRMVVHSALNLRADQAGWGRGSFKLTAMVSQGPSSPLANLLRKANFAQMAQVQSTQTVRMQNATARRTPAAVLLEELEGRGG